MKTISRWREFAGRGYTLEDLGRPAIFLLPIKKLHQSLGRGETIESDLHRFLIEHFGAYTSATIPSFGFWKSIDRVTISDECREYEVSFFGKTKVPVLIKKLAEIAEIIGEECIYLKAGQYTCLIYPRKTKKPSH